MALESISSSSSSPPALEDCDGPPGLDEEMYDPLDQANLRYAMPTVLDGFQGRAASPNSTTSSNEAEDGGSDNDASPWGKHAVPDASTFPNPVLKPASFSPNYDEASYTWAPGQEPPSPPSRSVSELGDPNVVEQWDSDDAAQQRLQPGRLPFLGLDGDDINP